ncbi:MAG: hypothetical protein IT380_25130 [Myxococcales bacterium]|nr:hypothetical protein [Myxococcales bacterium]
MTRLPVRLFSVCLGLAAAGCGLDVATSTDAPPIEGRSGSLAAGPVSLRYVPTAAELQALRAATLAAFPKADFTISGARGTLATLTNFSLGLGPCPRGRSANARVLDALAASPDVFRLDPAEWAADGEVSCDGVEPAGTWLSLARQRAGNEPVTGQALHVLARPVPGGLEIDRVVGVWLPVAPALERAMPFARAAAVPQQTLRQTVEKTPLGYTTFKALCWAVGHGEYKTSAPDVLSFGAARWRMHEDGVGVTMWLEQPARLEVAPENVTPTLRVSDAWCPPLAGFALSFDALSGALVSFQPGLDCVVCLAP